MKHRSRTQALDHIPWWAHSSTVRVLTLLVTLLAAHGPSQAQPTREDILRELRTGPAVSATKRTLLLTDLDQVRVDERDVLARLTKAKATEHIAAAHDKRYIDLQADAAQLYAGPVAARESESACAHLPTLARRTWELRLRAVREPSAPNRQRAEQADGTYLKDRARCVRELKG